MSETAGKYESGGTKHTPGPWTLENKTYTFAIVEDNMTVAEVLKSCPGDAEKVALLITAAPSLLQFAKTYLQREKGLRDHPCFADALCLECMAERAIAKAEKIGVPVPLLPVQEGCPGCGFVDGDESGVSILGRGCPNCGRAFLTGVTE